MRIRSRAASAPLLALALAAVWLVLVPRTPDLAAQVYRVGLFEHAGLQVWDEHWYAGHDLPGYSLLLGPLASLLGLRLLGVVAVVTSAALFERLAVRFYGVRAWWGAMWFAVAAVGDIWSGRITFAVGVSFALAAVLALAGRRPLLAAPLAALSAAASPVAGVLLGLAAVTHALTGSPSGRRSSRAVVALAVPAAAVVVPLTLLFPEGGTEPFPVVSFAVTAVVSLAFLLALPRGQPLLRNGAIVFLLACVACLVVSSPIGSNVERYGVLLAGPLLVCARVRAAECARAACRGSAEEGGEAGGGTQGGSAGGGSAGGGSAGEEGTQGGGAGGRGAGEGSTYAGGARRARGWRGFATGGLPPWGVGIALCLIGTWVVWGPVRETVAVAGEESTQASYYAPVERFLASRRAEGPVRIEVPLTRSHWEAALLAPRVSLARGWEKQLDERYDGVLLEGGLTAASYLRWLREEAVAYVALPDAPLDPSSKLEGRVIAGRPAYLSEVFTSAHWRIYAVREPTPIAAGPGALVSLGHDSFALRADAAGRFLVRVHFTPYFTVGEGSACVSQAPGGWTWVTVEGAGEIRVIARFSLARVLGDGRSCRTR